MPAPIPRAVPFASALSAKLGLRRDLLARLAGYPERQISEWEAGGAMSEASLGRLREVERLRDRLAEVVRAEAIPAWLEAPNPAFAGQTPLEVVERGGVGRLWQMLTYLESGVAS